MISEEEEEEEEKESACVLEFFVDLRTSLPALLAVKKNEKNRRRRKL
jgi:hypothetical protein